MNGFIESTTYLTAAAASFSAAVSLTWLALSALFRLLPGRAAAGAPASQLRPRIVHRRVRPVVPTRLLRVIRGGKQV